MLYKSSHGNVDSESAYIGHFRILRIFSAAAVSAPASKSMHTQARTCESSASVRVQAAQMGSNPPGAPLLEDELDADSMRMSSDAKQLPGGQTRHAARRAAASLLLYHGSQLLPAA